MNNIYGGSEFYQVIISEKCIHKKLVIREVQKQTTLENTTGVFSFQCLKFSLYEQINTLVRDFHPYVRGL